MKVTTSVLAVRF